MLDPKISQALALVTTATLTTVLFKKGLRNVWMRATAPLAPNQPRIVGKAFTLRFIPAREDLASPAAWLSPTSTRAAVEAMPEGCIAVAGTMGLVDAGIFGDILCARMEVRKVGGLVTDGVIRDRRGILTTNLPIWCSGAAAPPAVAQMIFAGWQEPIGCGGVAIYPDDVIVADDDGGVVIPAALVHEVAEIAAEQEQSETWILEEVKTGAALSGLYPMDAKNLARYNSEKNKTS